MAPTEVLAGQHLRSVAALLDRVGGVAYLDLLASRPAKTAEGQVSLLDSLAEPDPVPDAVEARADEPVVTYAMLTGAVTGKDRQRVLEGVADGNVDLVVGTHALVQEAVTFADLSLAVVDEQHRFGLHQRSALKSQGRRDGRADHDRHADPAGRWRSPTTETSTWWSSTSCRRGAVRSRRAPSAAPASGRPPTTSSAARSPRAGRPSWCVPRSTRATAPRSRPPRPRPNGSPPRSSPICGSSCCTGACVRRTRRRSWIGSERARPIC